ncbi:hypothetical protein [Glaciimonas sp. PAMC28666]|uniref:hypothetical protein n=1 Tax=Glaciimonas sp. PAMC28666 TaxID=2807626 RepID=UPI001965D383|nr:hypothetical protein [Glaciimonas sp. PAMC28666]QRX80848.1 hypothetical protein JQN73_11450 [Glaciimonas sp. PAMC28666]
MIKPTPSPIPDALHQSFSWLPDEYKTDPAAQFYAMTKDICHGIQTCVDLAHFSTMDRDNDTIPMLNISDTDRLLRLALTSAQMLGDRAADRIDDLPDRTGKGAE